MVRSPFASWQESQQPAAPAPPAAVVAVTASSTYLKTVLQAGETNKNEMEKNKLVGKN